MAMLDLTAAFDLVDYVILLRRLHSNFRLAQPIILLLVLYTAELLEVIQARGLSGHAYVDDTQLYGSCLPSQTAALRSNVIHCIEDKTDFTWCATSRIQHHIDQNLVRP